MSDGGRQHKRTAPGQPDAAASADAELVPRQGGLFGADRMSAVNAEREDVAASLRHRMGIMRKADGNGRPTTLPEGSGQPLPGAVRAKMEPRLGSDLSGVRVHTGGESAEAATSLGARAFTVGSDVHFGAGEFAPGSKEGDRLLAHELTHVVQGQRSGIQRKADVGSEGEHASPEVSKPDEPAEKEADAHADHIAESLHGDDGKKQPKGKKKGNEKSDDKASASGSDDEAHAGAGDAVAHEAKEHGGNAPKEAPTPVAAKLDSSGGQKIFRTPSLGSPAPLSGGKKIFRKPPTPSTAPPASPTAGATPPGGAPADPDVPLPDIQKQLVDVLAPKNIYSAAEVAPLARKLAPSGKLKKSDFDKKKTGNLEPELLLEWRVAAGDETFAKDFSKPDSLATRNLAQVDGANPAHFEGGGSMFAQHRRTFFDTLGNAIIQGGVKRTSVFNAAFYNASKNVRMKGKVISDKLPNLLNRAVGYSDFKKYNINPTVLSQQALAWYNGRTGKNVDLPTFEAMPDAEKLKDDYLKQAGGNQAAIRAMMMGTLHPNGGNWWTPNQLNVKGGEAGFAQLLTVFALEPQWFADGTVFFTADISAVRSLVEARKPTCFDGMQSGMWVPREEGGQTFGVTGGGIQEAMVKGVPVDSITKFQCNFPSPDLSNAIKTFEAHIRSKTGGSAMDALQRTEGDPNARNQLTTGMRNVGPGGAALNDLSQGIHNRTQQEREQPTSTAQAAKNSTVQSPGTQRPRTV